MRRGRAALEEQDERGFQHLASVVAAVVADLLEKSSLEKWEDDQKH